MVEEHISGTHDPEVLAAPAKGRLRTKILVLQQALEGDSPAITRGSSASSWRTSTRSTRRSPRCLTESMR